MLKKKLLSLVCVVAMFTTFMATFSVANATDPLVTLSIAGVEKVGALNTQFANFADPSKVGAYVGAGKAAYPVYAVKVAISGLKTVEYDLTTYMPSGLVTDGIIANFQFDDELFEYLDLKVTTPLSGNAITGALAGATDKASFTWFTTAGKSAFDGEIGTVYLLSKSAADVTAEAEFTILDSSNVTVDYYDGTSYTAAISNTQIKGDQVGKVGYTFNKQEAPTLANFEALNAAIADADAIDADKYVSVEDLNKAIDAAKDINQETETDQAKVDAAVKAIKDAIAALVLKPVAITGVSIKSKPAVREGYNTYGVMATVNTADSKYVQVDFVDATKLLVVDLGTVIDNVPVTFGLNIMSVPSTETISIEENGVTAINALPAVPYVVVAAEAVTAE